MGVADEEIVHDQGESGGVGVVAEEHGGGGFREAVLGEEAFLLCVRACVRGLWYLSALESS